MSNTVAKYQKYAEYQDSGIDWLGEIPSHWTMSKLRYLFDFSKGLSITKENLQDEGIPCVNYGEVHSKYGFEVDSRKHPLKCVSENYLKTSENALLNNGDFVFADTSEDLKGSGNFTHLVGNEQIFAGFHTVIARPHNAFTSRFYAYLFDSKEFRSQIQLAVKGVKVFSITQAILRSADAWLPSPDEQTQIATFLDHETAKIDSLISKQEKLIELLKEKRQAVISHAVTKGLNPDVNMKDSGVEWLGKVPEHWKLGRLKNVLSINNGRDYKNIEVEEGGYPVYGSGGIFKRSSDYLYDGISILFGRKGTIDKPLLVQGRFWTVDTMFYSELTKNICPEYVYFQSLSFPFNKLSTNTALPSMTQEDLLNLGLVIPPIQEQIVISKLLIEYLEKNNSLMEKAKQAINLMQERRTALISSAVTGKIDVRNWQSSHKSNAVNKEKVA